MSSAKAPCARKGHTSLLCTHSAVRCSRRLLRRSKSRNMRSCRSAVLRLDSSIFFLLRESRLGGELPVCTLGLYSVLGVETDEDFRAADPGVCEFLPCCNRRIFNFSSTSRLCSSICCSCNCKVSSSSSSSSSSSGGSSISMSSSSGAGGGGG